VTSSKNEKPGRRDLSAVALCAANSCAYLSDVLSAYRAGQIVLSLPRNSKMRTLGGVDITERRTYDDAAGWFDEPFDPIRSDEPAQISFSSGTTGRPKAILISHRALADAVDRINAAMEVDATIREYVGVPVTFSFGFGRVRAVATAGGKSYLPKNGFDLSEITRMLSAGEINAISAVPTLWRMALANADAIRAAGQKVRWIEIGSQYMSRDEKEQMKTLFPNAKIVQHYGLTEASRSTLLDISGTTGKALESIGLPTGDVEVEIANDGAIRIRGSHVATGLVTGAGVTPVVGGDGWLVTADKGYLEDGYLYYKGRLDELINCGGVKIDPTQFEQRLLAGLGVGDGIAVGRVTDALRGERVLVAITPDAGVDRSLIEEKAITIAETYGLAGRGTLAFSTIAKIPTTTTGKVQRNKLAELPDLAKITEVEAVVPTDSGKTTELQTLWAEIIGVPTVGLDQSFYDLGGDSLSALTAIMRMETLGIAPDIARGIFDGKTIAELTGAATSATSDSVTEPLSSGKAAELQTLWAEIIGVPTVGLDQSFYDLGGDSLSALTAIMRMETLGIAPDIARGIFDGKTIRDLAGDDTTPTITAPTPQHVAHTPTGTSSPAMTFAEMMNSVHAIRGVLILWVVVVHWLPGVLARLPGDVAWVYGAINPMLRYGTPGFAMVFGLGVGALSVHQYSKNKKQFRRGNLFNVKLIVTGVLFMALFRIATLISAGTFGEPNSVSYVFYSAVAYYALAVLTLPILLGLISANQNWLLNTLLICAACVAINEVLELTIAPLELKGVLELAKILLSAKYGYFQMTSYVMIGVAFGLLLRQHHGWKQLVPHMFAYGAVLIVIGVSMLAETSGFESLSSFDDLRPWHLVIYAGATLWIVGAFCLLNRAGGPLRGSMMRRVNGFAITSGILALPIFVGHEVVIPAKSLLFNLGVPSRISLIIPLGIFLGGLAILYTRLLKIFGN
jgi:acyl-coenzyme A synthetase/AMP-(fatty) acid ligase/surface polysaccharide O-acyltransferase-like enzyme/acyl carrier protein